MIFLGLLKGIYDLLYHIWAMYHHVDSENPREKSLGCSLPN